MSDNASVKAFQARLARLPNALRRAAAEAVNEEAEKMAEIMRRAVPVKTARLQKSIRVEAGAHELQALVKAGDESTNVTARSGHGRYQYALGVEFGTAAAPARPFFWPSYRLRKKQAKAAITRKGKKGVRDSFGGD